MKVYNYNKNGFYTGSSDANPNPKSPGDFLLPAMATFIEPPESKKDKARVFNGTEWEFIPDYSSYVYYEKETKSQKRYQIGEEPDLEKYTDIEPLGDVDQFVDGHWILSADTIKKRAIAEAEAYLAQTDWYVIRFVEPDRGDPIPDEIKTKRTEALAVINNYSSLKEK